MAARRWNSRFAPSDLTGGLVLVPTRELAMQVCEAIHKYARGTGLTVVPLYGGSAMEQQIRALRSDGRPGTRPAPRTRHAGLRGHPQVRPRYRPDGGPALWRLVDGTADSRPPI